MNFCEDRLIRPMDESLIDKIAKGEVIESVVDVVKEIIENSLDAKSTEIEVRLSANGLSMIQVNDNGTGIHFADLPFVCKPFTTSKVYNCRDLNMLKTLGFRGEALSAISYLSHLKIITKTCLDKCAFAVEYIDGYPQNEPYPCAGNVGTHVTVEKLFYNSPMRQSFKQDAHLSVGQTKCLIKCYAIHYCHVGFLFKIIDNDQVVLKTMPDSTPLDNIRLLYDNNVTRKLKCQKKNRELIKIDENDEEYKFRLKGLITNASFSMKNFIFNLFVNNRFVESSCLKKVVDDIYEEYLSKNGKPFVYLSLDVHASELEVNLQARKCEVFILHENEIFNKIGSILKCKLLSQTQSRTFYMQTKMSCVRPKPIYFDNADFADNHENALEPFALSKAAHDRPQFASLCLPSSKDRNNFLPFNRDIIDEHQSNIKWSAFFGNQKSMKLRIKESAINSESVMHLRSSIKQSIDSQISHILFDSKFSGCIDFKYFLIQKDEKIFLCNTWHILIDYLYQKVLFNLKNLNVLSFDEPIPIRKIFDALPTKESLDVSKTQAHEILMQFSSILSQCFSIEIDKSFGLLLGIPELFDQYKPEVKQLPSFLFDLAGCLNGADETAGVNGVTMQIALYYAQSFSATCEKKPSQWKHFFKSVLFPELKKQYRPTKKVAEKMAIKQVADLQMLYSSFERC